jgi:hypothetical protein
MCLKSLTQPSLQLFRNFLASSIVVVSRPFSSAMEHISCTQWAVGACNQKRLFRNINGLICEWKLQRQEHWCVKLVSLLCLMTMFKICHCGNCITELGIPRPALIFQATLINNIQSGGRPHNFLINLNYKLKQITPDSLKVIFVCIISSFDAVVVFWYTAPEWAETRTIVFDSCEGGWALPSSR